MKIGEAEVRHVARLAELAVADADVAVLAAQLEGIVKFVAQLDEVPADVDRPGMSWSVRRSVRSARRRRATRLR